MFRVLFEVSLIFVKRGIFLEGDIHMLSQLSYHSSPTSGPMMGDKALSVDCTNHSTVGQELCVDF